MINAQEWLDKKYPKDRRNSIKKLDASGKELKGKLKLENFTNLENLNLSNNLLTELDLTSLSIEKLSEINIANNNFPEQDLTIFSRFTNLDVLCLGTDKKDRVRKGIFNRFCGSLELLKDLKSLEALAISNTDIDNGLEHLSYNLKEIYCSNDRGDVAGCEKIRQELKSKCSKKMGGYYDFQAWRKVYEKQLKVTISDQKRKDNLEEKPQVSEQSEIIIVPTMPSQWRNSLEGENRFEENYDMGEVNYDRTYHEKSPLWKKMKNGSLSTEDLPIRLYDLDKGKIMEIGKNANINHYAILSYSWGGNAKEDVKWSIENAEKRLSKGGKKSLLKAKDACYHLGIDYLWVDQLCINQDDPQEKAQEVPKMRQYYGNATVTLVSVHTNILDNYGEVLPSPDDVIKKIVSSPWFSRSWTYQEGWLSKQTLFMFDDALVDGRDLAQFWVSHQPLLVSKRLPGEYEENSLKIATPIGWVYYKDGYDLEKDKRVDINLSEALREIKNRGRGISIDGIYSILGLLPYGEKVVPKYKETEYEYTQKELQEALFDIMNTAAKNGYGDIFAWHGEGSCLVPEIDANKGSTSVVGGIVISCIPKRLDIEPNGTIKVKGSDYSVKSISDIKPLEEKGGFLIEGGLYEGTALVKVNNDNEPLMFKGTKKVLNSIKKEGKVLILLNKSEWKSSNPFAILASRRGKIYHRIGLVELGNGEGKLQGVEERIFSIVAMNVDTEQEHQSQIQIPPK